MDRVGQGLLETLWHSLLYSLGYYTVTSGVALGRTGVVDGVRNAVLNALGELLLSLAWHNGVAGCVRLIHAGIERCS